MPGSSPPERPGLDYSRANYRLTSLVKRPLNTGLSSGTSARTFAVSAGPYMNYCAETATKNEPDTFFVPVQKKGWRIDLHGVNLKSCECLFQGVQVNPYLNVDVDEGRQKTSSCFTLSNTQLER